MKPLFSTKEIPVEIAGVRVKPSLRARRLGLRVDARAGDVVLTYPRGASPRRALVFIEENRAWIEKQRAQAPPARKIAAGDKVTVLGRDYTIAHAPGRGVTRRDGDRIVVHGDAAHLPRRLRDFLKKEAVAALDARVREKTARLGLEMTSMRVIDPRSRWGSCGPDGRLMFSWRLVLAPPPVLDYVVAHEVAHRVHMNHGKKFWALCAALTADAFQARRWLKKHGQGLMGL